ncbi:MAG: ThuA domain-containing protein, partial [Ilumatobacteraceae bacterium]
IELNITGEHPITEGLPETIALSDEVYGDLRMSPRAEVLAVARRHPDDDDQPVIWTHRFGNGQVAHIGVAHDEHTITHPVIANIITRAASWLTQATPVHS